MPTRKRFDSMSARDTGLEYLLRRLDRLEGNPGLVARDTRRTGGTGGGVDPTFLVAASDASPGMRAAADWVCTGSGDQVEIQAAFDALPVGGGRVQLSEGTFDILITGGFGSGGVVMPNNSELVGVGPGTLLAMSGSGTHGIRTDLYAENKVRIANLRIDMAGATGNGVALYLIGPTIVESCWFTGMGQSNQSFVSYIVCEGNNPFFKPLISSCHFLDVYDGSC